jgi:hypothetical protein
MPLVVLRVLTPRKILMVAACVLTCAWFQTPTALAQRVGHPGGGGHFGTGGHAAAPHVGAPRIIAPPAPASRAIFLHPRSGFPERPFPIFPRPFFIRAPFFRYWERFDSSWWLYCGPVWGWNCGDFVLPEYPVEHYLAPPLTYNTTVYIYSLDGRQPLVQLFLKDGTVYTVNDYWFVDGQIHFTMLDESATKSVEQVVGFDDLDVQRTIDVNTRRGFRVVMRNEPMEQYLRDYPDLTPPLLQPPSKELADAPPATPAQIQTPAREKTPVTS